MKTLTVVAPAYNEAEGIRTFYEVLAGELKKLSYDWHILVVVDGGTDTTFEILQNIAAHDKKVSALKFSRNFGHQMALLAGIDHATSDVIITMDSDLQHPPSFIPKLLAEYEKGNDIVYTVRDDIETVSVPRRMIGSLFYFLINLVSEVPINRNASDFRLISGKVARVIQNNITERNLFLRGIISWVGFNQTSVVFTTQKRIAGRSKYSFSRLVQLATFGIVSFSKKPLRAGTVIGAVIALFGFIFAIVTVIQYFFGQNLPTGFATLTVLISLIGGVQLMVLGIIGEYIGAIFDEVKGRPRYIVAQTIGFHE